MKFFSPIVIVVVLAAPASAATVTGQVTYIGPDGTVILNRHDAYAVSPDVSLDAVSVRQTITAEVSDEKGVRTIIKLLPAPATPAQAIPAKEPVPAKR
jgi:hypothetical protein